MITKINPAIQLTMNHTSIKNEAFADKCDCEGKFAILDTLISIEARKIKLDLYKQKPDHKGKGPVLPTLIQFHVQRTSLVKVTFNRNSGECLAPDTQFTAASWKGTPACPGSAHTFRLSSWTPAQHSVTAGSYSKCIWQATGDGIFGGQQCLVLVEWARNFTL